MARTARNSACAPSAPRMPTLSRNLSGFERALLLYPVFRQPQRTLLEQLVRHTQIDYDREMVLVATERDEHAVESIIGEASYTVPPDSRVANSASWWLIGYGRGIATQLYGEPS